MRPCLIILLAPGCNLLAGVGKRQEPVGIQAFAPQAAIERFDERVGRVRGNLLEAGKGGQTRWAVLVDR